MTLRERLEEFEEQRLSEHAVKSKKSKGRDRPEEPCGFRTCFMRDVDRITYSKSFRRLKHKTQVFLRPEGDHYRTRLTHTLEVSRIARTIARLLSLNEDLTEAIALGHDLGHTPFGHAGEEALDRLTPYGFKHNIQSVRVVECLEKDGRGLNLTAEVRDGILNHTGGPTASTLEGRTVHFADRIAYINHDIDDAIRAGVLSESDLPSDVTAGLGDSHRSRIDTLVREIVNSSIGRPDIIVPGGILELTNKLRDFLFESVYNNPVAKSEESKVGDILSALYDHYAGRPEELPGLYLKRAETDGVSRAVCDYIAGMTDRFAVHKFKEIFIPRGWSAM